MEDMNMMERTRYPNRTLKELTEVIELVRQLEAYQEQPLCKQLAQNVISSLQKVILTIQSSSSEESRRQAARLNPTTESSPSASMSPDQSVKEQVDKKISKRRKTQSQWTARVKVGGGTEVSYLDDGYSWRKYGQKDILGSKHPRGYYRCSRRHSHGCLAMKQVQRSDNDPTVFDITYYGTHTCVQIPQQAQLPESQKQEMQPKIPESGGTVEFFHHQDQQMHNPLTKGVRCKRRSLESAPLEASPSFSFQFKPVSSMKLTNPFFSSYSMQDTCFISNQPPADATGAMPMISGMNNLYIPPFLMSNLGESSLHETETSLPGFVTPSTSATNSPMFEAESGELNFDYTLDDIIFANRF